MGWKNSAYPIINSDSGHTRTKRQLVNFCQSAQKHWQEREKEEKNAIQSQSILRYTQMQHKVSDDLSIWVLNLEFA